MVAVARCGQGKVLGQGVDGVGGRGAGRGRGQGGLLLSCQQVRGTASGKTSFGKRFRPFCVNNF